jgi:intein-encoded DNA endonuclease-like protein
MTGSKQKKKANKKWSANLAYAIGLFASDGSISKDGRHLDMSSNGIEQLENSMECVGIKNTIGVKKSGNSENICRRVQFGDVSFCEFLFEIGLTSAKSKTIGKLKIPKKYFFDFLRGSFDGDGCFYSYYDLRWKSSFMYYTTFISASREHIDWIREEIFDRLRISGHITHSKAATVYQLKYAKKDSFQILRSMYNGSKVICLSRKRQKVEKALNVEGKSLPI